MLPKKMTLGVWALALIVPGVYGDGIGLIGFGKTMYQPTCAFACRGVVSKCTLACTPKDSNENHGTTHNPVTTPPECFVSDPAFLKTMALCLDNYCPSNGNPSIADLNDYWASHLGTGTLGTRQYVPVMSYVDALVAAREDETHASSGHGSEANATSASHHHRRDENSQMTKLVPRHGSMVMDDEVEMDAPDVNSPLPVIAAKEELNVTSFIPPKPWQLQYNGNGDFEANESDHSKYTIVLTVVAIALPLIFSSLRFIPGLEKSYFWTLVNSKLVYPAVSGKKHRTPVAMAIGGGMVPTRGQALYIGFISMLNIFFLLGPFHSHMPQSTFVSLANQSLSVIGNRSGCLAMANLTAMLIFTARNSVLLYVTDWSHNTYLLLHRWLGYWVIFHSILHSILLLCCYVYYGDYKAELVRKYWIWGIVATVAACAILPTSVLIVRKTAYEIFLVAHVVLAIVFIVGYYLHIWYVFQYDWGLEIWAFIAAAIWGLEVLARFIRKTINGFHTATITPIADTNGEYLRIDIEGVQLHSVAYLGFPTLGWRFWETHPFSVASARGFTKEDSSIGEIDEAPGPVSSSEKTKEQSTSTRHAVMETQNHNGSTFFARTRSGVTKQLAHRIQTASNAPVRLRVVIDGPYPSGPSTELSQCSDIVCIAGGIGITAVLPFLRSFPSPRHGKLFWGCRQQGLVNALEAELTSLPASINVVTSVGQRLALADILQRELTPTLADKGLVALVVCGPPAMADEVRHCLHLLATANAIRPFILCDEAFSW